MHLSRFVAGPPFIGFPGGSSGSNASVTLTNAFVNATSGDAIALRYMCQTLDPINAIAVFVTAVNGSPVIAANIYGENVSNTARPATGSPLDSSTGADTPAAGEWCEIQFGTPYTPSVIGEILWIVIHKTGGTSIDIRSSGTGFYPAAGGQFIGHGLFLTTTGGFSANGTVVTKNPWVLKQGSNYFGQPFTQRTAAFYASNTLERGIKFVPTFDCTAIGCVWDTGSANLDLIAIYDAAGVPGGTALDTFSLDSVTGMVTAQTMTAVLFDTPVPLNFGKTYYATFRADGSHTAPVGLIAEGYSNYSTELLAVRMNNPTYPIGVIDNGAGGWTEQPEYMPGMALLLDQITSRPPASRVRLGM